MNCIVLAKNEHWSESLVTKKDTAMERKLALALVSNMISAFVTHNELIRHVGGNKTIENQSVGQYYK